MQVPTCTDMRVRNVRDAHTIFHGVMLHKLPMITRRLDTEERRAVRPGNVYVWEERGRNADASNVRNQKLFFRGFEIAVFHAI